MQNFRLCEKNILKSKRRSFQSNKKSNNLFKSFKKKNMVCQKRQFLRKIISQPLYKNANFSAKRLRGLTVETGRDTRGYKRLQGGTKGYKGLEGVGGERKICKRICQKSNSSNQVLCQFEKKKHTLSKLLILTKIIG